MASLQIDPSGNYHVKFRFAGKQYRRSLHTKMRRTAEASACHIEENIRLIEGGRLELPEDADVPTFLLSDGKLLGKPPFQTVKQIERLIKSHKLMKEKADEIWEAAYLDTSELNELLDFVKENSKHEFLYGKRSDA